MNSGRPARRDEAGAQRLLRHVEAVGEALAAEAANACGSDKRTAATTLAELIREGTLIRFASPAPQRGKDVVMTRQAFNERRGGEPETVLERSADNGRRIDDAVRRRDGAAWLASLTRQEQAISPRGQRRRRPLERDWETHGWGAAYAPSGQRGRPAFHWTIATERGAGTQQTFDRIEGAVTAAVRAAGRGQTPRTEHGALANRLEDIVFLTAASEKRLAWIRLTEWITVARRAAIVASYNWAEAQALSKARLGGRTGRRHGRGER